LIVIALGFAYLQMVKEFLRGSKKTTQGEGAEQQARLELA
jgi:hypothetical protein